MGEIQAADIEAAPFDSQEFRRSLLAARNLTVRTAGNWNTELRDLCASAGVAVVFTREIPKASVSGATHWLTKDKALIQLSLKYKTDDQLWFTFFHEAGHILLHGKKRWFVEDGAPGNEDEEQEANDFSRDLLIPPEWERQLPHLKSQARISQFACKIGVAPGIVVGRLQREKLLPFSHCNGLKRRIVWKDA
jgi:Zn-dependent peptidase ImmA (M78 family)